MPSRKTPVSPIDLKTGTLDEVRGLRDLDNGSLYPYKPDGTVAFTVDAPDQTDSELAQKVTNPEAPSLGTKENYFRRIYAANFIREGFARLTPGGGTAGFTGVVNGSAVPGLEGTCGHLRYSVDGTYVYLDQNTATSWLGQTYIAGYEREDLIPENGKIYRSDAASGASRRIGKIQRVVVPMQPIYPNRTPGDAGVLGVRDNLTDVSQGFEDNKFYRFFVSIDGGDYVQVGNADGYEFRGNRASTLDVETEAVTFRFVINGKHYLLIAGNLWSFIEEHFPFATKPRPYTIHGQDGAVAIEGEFDNVQVKAELVGSTGNDYEVRVGYYGRTRSINGTVSFDVPANVRKSVSLVTGQLPVGARPADRPFVQITADGSTDVFRISTVNTGISNQRFIAGTQAYWFVGDTGQVEVVGAEDATTVTIGWDIQANPGDPLVYELITTQTSSVTEEVDTFGLRGIQLKLKHPGGELDVRNLTRTGDATNGITISGDTITYTGNFNSGGVTDVQWRLEDGFTTPLTTFTDVAQDDLTFVDLADTLSPLVTTIVRSRRRAGFAAFVAAPQAGPAWRTPDATNNAFHEAIDGTGKTALVTLNRRLDSTIPYDFALAQVPTFTGKVRLITDVTNDGAHDVGFDSPQVKNDVAFIAESNISYYVGETDPRRILNDFPFIPLPAFGYDRNYNHRVMGLCWHSIFLSRSNTLVPKPQPLGYFPDVNHIPDTNLQRGDVAFLIGVNSWVEYDGTVWRITDIVFAGAVEFDSTGTITNIYSERTQSYWNGVNRIPISGTHGSLQIGNPLEIPAGTEELEGTHFLGIGGTEGLIFSRFDGEGADTPLDMHHQYWGPWARSFDGEKYLFPDAYPYGQPDLTTPRTPENNFGRSLPLTDDSDDFISYSFTLNRTGNIPRGGKIVGEGLEARFVHEGYFGLGCDHFRVFGTGVNGWYFHHGALGDNKNITDSHEFICRHMRNSVGIHPYLQARVVTTYSFRWSDGSFETIQRLPFSIDASTALAFVTSTATAGSPVAGLTGLSALSVALDNINRFGHTVTLRLGDYSSGPITADWAQFMLSDFGFVRQVQQYEGVTNVTQAVVITPLGDFSLVWGSNVRGGLAFEYDFATRTGGTFTLVELNGLLQALEASRSVERSRLFRRNTSFICPFR